MRLLYSYLRRYWTLVGPGPGPGGGSTQIFSLLDPLIFRHVIDKYAHPLPRVHDRQFFRGVSVLLAAAVGAAFVSRVAKTSRTTSSTWSTQRLGGVTYTRTAVRHSLETAPNPALRGPAKAARRWASSRRSAPTSKSSSARPVNTLFTTLVGVIFVMVYAFTVSWIIAPVFLLTNPRCVGVLSSGAVAADQEDPEGDRRRDHGAGGSDDQSRCATSSWSEPGPGAARRSGG